jgi:AAA family ATP:ADP antiporter
VNTYQVKAWVDMLGYRLFKILGSGLILAASAWFGAGAAQLSGLTFAICAAWLCALTLLATECRAMTARLRS